MFLRTAAVVSFLLLASGCLKRYNDFGQRPDGGGAEVRIGGEVTADSVTQWNDVLDGGGESRRSDVEVLNDLSDVVGVEALDGVDAVLDVADADLDGDSAKADVPDLEGEGALPQCGNGKCEQGEDKQTCCKDCPCSEGEACAGDNGCESCKTLCEWAAAKCGKVLECACGECDPVTEVCQDGQCKCVPDCTGKQCGDDGCGGSCGECQETQHECQNGQCVCVPDCSGGNECGSNGCGAMCGVCSGGKVCAENKCWECWDKDNEEDDGCDKGIISDIQVSKPTSQKQEYPAIASSPEGKFVVVWQANCPGACDGYDIRCQAFAEDGNSYDPQETVNVTTALEQRYPAAAWLEGELVAVVWESQVGDSAHSDIKARVIDPFSSYAGPEFDATQSASDEHHLPDVTWQQKGFFAAVWDTENGWTPGGELGWQRWLSPDVGASVEVVANTTKEGLQWRAVAAGCEDYTTVVVWESFDSGQGNENIRARMLDEFGDQKTAEFIVSLATAGPQRWPAAASFGYQSGLGCRRVVVWEHHNTGGSQIDLAGRILTVDGAPFGPDIKINSTSAQDQYDPDVAVLSTGGFVVVWQSCPPKNDPFAGQDGDGCGIFGRIFNANGVPAGEDFQVNKGQFGDQVQPAVAALPQGRFVVAWATDDEDFVLRYKIMAQPFDQTGKRIFLGN